MKKLYPVICVLIICFFNICPLSAQQNPSGINWKSIDTGTYEIIFPEEITPLGQRVANLMVHYEKYNYLAIKTRPRRIPIVLVNNYTDSNGFVSFAPYYSHLFTTPTSSYSIEWIKLLSIHEGHHMVQRNKLTDGFGKGLWRVLLGDNGTNIFSFLYVPDWYLEGDSVVTETALTQGGRGRFPSFDLYQRAIDLSGNRYSYYHNYLGSYESLYPYADHYRLGYLLCSYIQKHYGIKVWNKVLEDTGKYFLWYNFATALKYQTGKTLSELYHAALDEYRLLWKEQLDGVKLTEAEILTPDRKSISDNLSSHVIHFDLGIIEFSKSINPSIWESFLFPSITGSGDLTAVRYSRDSKIQLVKINEKSRTEDIVHLPFSVSSTGERMISTGGDFALWCEFIPDPRWGYRSFSDLKLLNINTGRTKYISHKRKFISSTLSADGKIAAGIEYGPDLEYYLTVINTETGVEQLHQNIKNRGYLFDPAFSPDGKDIAVAASADSFHAILLYNIESNKITNLIDYTDAENLTTPVFYGKYLIYGSTFSGIDNIYAIDMTNKKRYQVTSRPLGAYFPSINNDTLYFNDYSVNGYKAASMKLDPKEWLPLNKVDKRVINYIDSIAEKLLPVNNSIDEIPQREYPVKNYNPILNSINFFGWTPYFTSNPSSFILNMISSDVLQTTDIILSYTRNFNEKQNTGTASIVYRGLYPVITLDGCYGGRTVSLYNRVTNKYSYNSWNEISGSGEVSFPLNFSRGIHKANLSFGAEDGYIKVYDKKGTTYIIDNTSIQKDKRILYDGYLNYARYFFTFVHQISGALDSLSPGFAQVMDISYINTPFNGDYTGSLFSAGVSFYFPGLTDMQGLKISGTYEKIKYVNYVFPQQFLFPRGYDNLIQKHLYKATADYSFPIVNFSMNIWKLVYFKRINGNIFYDFGAAKGDYFYNYINGNTDDFGHLKNDNGYNYYRSAGFELTAEQNFLSNRYLALELGIRYSRCFDAKENQDKNRYDIVVKAPL